MSKIEWTEQTWNPVSGCSRLSDGCKNCYAETMTKRLAAIGQKKYQGLLNDQGRFNGVLKFDEKALLKPLSIKKPTMFFVNSMSDLFHENIPGEWIDKAFAVMTLCPQHTFQILTKRAKRMRDYFKDTAFKTFQVWIASNQISDSYKSNAVLERLQNLNAHDFFPLPNVWLGVSVENQKAAETRIPHLLNTPAAVRFLSCEPLLEEINIRGHLLSANRVADCKCGHGHSFTRCPNTGGIAKNCHVWKCECSGFRGINGISWAIIGGESGNGARPCDISWIRLIVEQCKAAGTKVFVKQLGKNSVINYYDELREDAFNNDDDWTPLNWNLRDGQPPLNTIVKFPKKDKKGGLISEFPEDLRIRQMPV